MLDVVCQIVSFYKVLVLCWLSSVRLLVGIRLQIWTLSVSQYWLLHMILWSIQHVFLASLHTVKHQLLTVPCGYINKLRVNLYNRTVSTFVGFVVLFE